MSDDQKTVTIVHLPPPDKLQGAIEETRRNLPILLANADIMAQMRKANYDALVAAGFTEAQALELCWR
jgi:hypothetical protein